MITFDNQTNQIDKALMAFLKGSKKKSLICLVSNGRYFRAWVPAHELTDKERLQLEQSLMSALIADRNLFDAFYRIVEPVRRFYNRKDKKTKSQSKD